VPSGAVLVVVLVLVSVLAGGDEDGDEDEDEDEDGIGSSGGSGTVGLRAGGCPYGVTSPGVVGQGTGSLRSSAAAGRAHERASANTTIPIRMLRFQRARNSSAEASGSYERPR
jgi:hypothetical protein